MPKSDSKSLEPNLTKGIVYILFGFLFMAFFGAFLKGSLANSTSPIWINFIVYLTGLVLLLPFAFIIGRASLKTKHFKYHFCRAFFGFLASLLYIYSLQFIPLLNATLLFNTTPIFIPIFAMWLIKVKIEWFTWLSIIVGFIGITIMIHPSINTFHHPGNLIALVAGMLLALAYTFIKMLTPTDPYFRIVFYFFLLSTLFQTPFLYFVNHQPQSRDVLLSICAGASLLIAQWCIVTAYANAEASKIGVFQYTSLIWVGLIDWVLWHVIPTPFEFFGMLLVMLAGIIITLSPLWEKKSSNPG